jgi:uncharacterized protein with GYD domain
LATASLLDQADGRKTGLAKTELTSFRSRQGGIFFCPSGNAGHGISLTRIFANERRIHMPTFILSLDWTDQGIRGVKEAPKRSQAARELAKKLGVEIKQVYLTSGEHDLLLIVETASGDNVAKFALATGALGNVRTTTARAWSESEFGKLLSELP